MTIERLMSRHVKHCRPDDTLEQAAALMWEHDCGCLPVCTADAESRVIGMLTDRDICMAALFQGRPLRDLKVADSMSRDIRVSRVDDRPEDVERLMREQRIRRVPVMDTSGALVGIVSLADLALAAHAGGNMAEREVGHTLAAICQSGTRRVEAAP